MSRLKETAMNAHAIFRPLLVAFALALLTTGIGLAPAAAKGTTDLTDTMSRENFFVQACSGFDITSSYTTVRKYHIVEDHTGLTVFERRGVTFNGTVSNAASGKGFGFVGGFTRVADYEQGAISISDLTLNLDLPDHSDVSVSIAHQEGDLIDNPAAVLLKFAPFAYRNGLCDLLGDSTSESPGVLSPQVLDPCLNQPRGKPC
jgi:hypothetical protein